MWGCDSAGIVAAAAVEVEAGAEGFSPVGADEPLGCCPPEEPDESEELDEQPSTSASPASVSPERSSARRDGGGYSMAASGAGR
ncbi:hypothetical protein GCM10009738_32310 [Kitasatospora viridis]